MNDFGCKHSKTLQEHFDIENRGIDYFNDAHLGFEFKESWAKDLNQMFFKVPKVQLQNSNYIIFCIYDKEFYVHNSLFLRRKYPFDNGSKHCCLRYNTIRKNYIVKFDNYKDLKDYIEGLTYDATVKGGKRLS